MGRLAGPKGLFDEAQVLVAGAQEFSGGVGGGHIGLQHVTTIQPRERVERPLDRRYFRRGAMRQIQQCAVLDPRTRPAPLPTRLPRQEPLVLAPIHRMPHMPPYMMATYWHESHSVSSTFIHYLTAIISKA